MSCSSPTLGGEAGVWVETKTGREVGGWGKRGECLLSYTFINSYATTQSTMADISSDTAKSQYDACVRPGVQTHADTVTVAQQSPGYVTHSDQTNNQRHFSRS